MASRVLHLDPAGDPIASEEDGRTLLEEGMAADAEWIAVPVERLGEPFFALETKVAGAIVQRLQQYGFGLAVVGDVSARTAASESFRGLVVEADRRRTSLLFVRDEAELRARLDARAA